MKPRGVCDVLALFRAEHERLHREWSADVGRHGYNKRRWMERDNSLTSRYRAKLDALGYSGPLLP